MKKRIFAVAAALCLMAGTGAFAQEAKPAPATKEPPPEEHNAHPIPQRMHKEQKHTHAPAKDGINQQ